MSDDEIKAIAVQLESAARVEDAKFSLEPFPEHYNTRILIANRVGFLSLAVLLLHGAVAEANIVNAQLPTFSNQHADLFFENIERREEWPEVSLEDARLSVKERISSFLHSIGCWTFVAVVLFLAIVGLITTLKWIF